MILSIFMNISCRCRQSLLLIFGSSVLLSIFSPPNASAYTFVPGKSNAGIQANWEQIERTLNKHPRLREQVTKELHGYNLCRNKNVLLKEQKEESKLCTNLYRALVKEKIWFQDEMLWEIVNYTTITKTNPKGKETCYDAKLLGTGDGIKCYKPKIIDPKTGEPKKFRVSCSKESLSKTDRKTQKDFLNYFGDRDFDSISNDHLIDCAKSAKEGSQLYRRAYCWGPLSLGMEDERMGLIIGKYCRDNFPELMTGTNSYGDDPDETRKRIQIRIAGELIKFQSQEARSRELDNSVYRDLMSNKYSKKERRFNCMESAINNFADAPNFYKDYCNTLMR